MSTLPLFMFLSMSWILIWMMFAPLSANMPRWSMSGLFMKAILTIWVCGLIVTKWALFWRIFSQMHWNIHLKTVVCVFTLPRKEIVGVLRWKIRESVFQRVNRRNCSETIFGVVMSLIWRWQVAESDWCWYTNWLSYIKVRFRFRVLKIKELVYGLLFRKEIAISIKQNLSLPKHRMNVWRLL